MTQRNWAKMVKNEISGELTGTCLVAAIDCLLEDRDIPARVYREVEDSFYRFVKGEITSLEQIDDVYRLILRYAIGSNDINKVLPECVTISSDLIWIISEARRFGKMVLIYITVSHIVGLRPLDNGLWEMVGNSVPTRKHLQNNEVFSYLYIPSDYESDSDNLLIVG